jgi:ribosome maturation factor RimP
MAGKEALLLDLIKPVVEALALQLWGIEYISHAKQTVVRIYIDHPDGIDVDHCAAVSRQVSSVFDVEDPIAGVYTLEVSSPGMERPLFTLEQYKTHAGERVKVKLRVAFDGRRNFSGQLAGVEDDDVVVIVDDHEYLLPFDAIDKANIVPQF